MKGNKITLIHTKYKEICDRFIIYMVFWDRIVLVYNSWIHELPLGLVPKCIELLSCFDMVQPKVPRTRLGTLSTC